jgi:hypothetical protein
MSGQIATLTCSSILGFCCLCSNDRRLCPRSLWGGKWPSWPMRPPILWPFLRTPRRGQKRPELFLFFSPNGQCLKSVGNELGRLAFAGLVHVLLVILRDLQNALI